MTAVTVLLVAVAGGLGAALRLLVDGLVNGLGTGRSRAPLPLGTLTINVTGSFVLGLVTGLAPHLGALPVALIGTGLMGGYTTFSTASVETVRLVRAGRTVLAAVNGFGMLVVAVAAAVLGVVLGGLA